MSQLKLLLGSFYTSISHHLRVLAVSIESSFQPPRLDWGLATTTEPVKGDNPLSSDRVKELLDEIFDSILLAVPKKRRSIRVIRRRRVGVENYSHGSHLIRPKENLVPCHVCGNYMQIGYLCEHCFQKNVEETKVIQNAMIKEFGFQPIEHDVHPVYKGEEKPNKPGFRFIPIEKERPQWFSSNLMSRTTSNTKSVPGDVIVDDKKKE